MAHKKHRRGAAMILSMIFLVVFAVLAIAMNTMSGMSLQTADNQRRANSAFANAESGLEVERFWLNRVMIPSSTAPADYLDAIVADVRSDLADNHIYNLVVYPDGIVAPAMLDSARPDFFEGRLFKETASPEVLKVYARGVSGPVTRTVAIDFDISPYKHPIFNFGLATKGPLNFPGNPTFTGVTDNWEADIYVESTGSATAIQVLGNANFDGDLNIANPAANVDFRRDVNIAGDLGQDAIDNHVNIGVESPEFPVPDTARFLQYATGSVIDDTTDISKGMTLTNALIEAGANPTFEGSVTINGILYIEQPNQVTFGRNVSLNGLIVAEGDVSETSENHLAFNGNFATGPFPEGSEFDAIRHETGSSILAPGFSAYFSGNFSTVNGVMALGGVHFAGNASALIQGTIINYSDTPAVVEGNATLNFDRAGSVEIPAGFDLYRVLEYKPSSYTIMY